ncbi:putative bifunctional diguanylate cyclase/phosphodiesterase [Jatrophihabitans fulvus]
MTAIAPLPRPAASRPGAGSRGTAAGTGAVTATSAAPHPAPSAPSAPSAPERRAGGRTTGFLAPWLVWTTVTAVVSGEFVILHAIHVQVRSTPIADVLYAGLLALATIGWTLWFQRLVRRHRRVEHLLTAEKATADGAERLAALVQRSADLILVADADGVVTYASPSARALLGVAPAELVGTVWTDLLVRDDRVELGLVAELIRPGVDATVTARLLHADGNTLDVEGTVANRTDDPAVGGTVITLRDVTRRVQLERELTRQAFQDALTGLPNRRLFSDRLAHALQVRRDEAGRHVAVLFCDLDDFKAVNDSLGHGVGDTVLQEFARRAVDVVRPGDTVARLGGDEFAVLLDDLDAAAALPIAEDLLAAFGRPIDVAGQMVCLGVSVGVAAIAADDSDGVELLRTADVAMYLAKNRGRGTVQVYDGTLEEDTLNRLALRAELQAALDDGLVVPHFQPVIDLDSGDVVGYEALARWTRSDGSAVPPSRFVPVAEQTGLVHALGSAVLTDACRAGVRFHALAGRPLDMSVNITVQQLVRPGFTHDVLAVLRLTGFPAASLVLEITESTLATGIEAVTDHLRVLREHGIRIAIDDFGTGFSSLSYLRTLPVDALKIDKSFLDNVTRDAHDAAVAAAVVSIGSAVDLTVVAEGVEHEDQARWLAGTSCRRAQGYLWSAARDEATTAAALERDVLRNVLRDALRDTASAPVR